VSDTQWASWRCTCVEKSKGDVAVLAFATVSTSFDYHFEMIMLQYTDALSMRSEFVPCIWNAFMVLLLPSYEHHSTKTHTHTHALVIRKHQLHREHLKFFHSFSFV